MPDVSQALNAALFVVPGFLFVQVLYLVGVARERSDFERAAWSIVLSLPLRWVGTKLVTLLGLETNPGLTFEMYLLAVALAGGLVIFAIKSLFFFEEEVTEG